MDDTDDTGSTGDSAEAEARADDARPRARTGRIERQVARRHRRDRIAGVLIAVLGVAVAIIAIVALRNPHTNATAAGTDTHHASSSVPAKPSASHPLTLSPSATPSSHRSSAPAGAEPLVVLNQTTTPGLASQAAQRFRTGGWKVTGVQEAYQNDVITTTAYYDPAVAGAQKAAQELAKQYPTIHRVAAKFPELPAGPVVVVLTTDYSST
ncbi:MAG TPA: LytR C-terminal domain-containing protein [Jatrophihabitans sp.]|jgi:guanyl-specific ribonuclease Sa